jgi:type VI secretion system protein ImpA
MNMAIDCDLDTILKPIPGDSPCGPDGKSTNSPAYQTLLSIRNIADDLENEAEKLAPSDQPEKLTASSNNWRALLFGDTENQSAFNYLAAESKDMRVATWLTEAMIRHDGFRGLAVGLKLIRELLLRYWDAVHPLPLPGKGMQPRFMPLRVLNGSNDRSPFVRAIGLTKLFDGNEPLLFRDYRDSRSATDIERRTQLNQRLQTARNDYKRTGLDADAPDPLRDAADAIRNCQGELESLTTFLKTKCPEQDRPDFSIIANELKTCLTVVDFELKAVGTRSSLAKGDKRVSPDHSPTDATNSWLEVRANAIANLMEISSLFKRYETHSPVPYCIDKAVKWAAMPLPELWITLLKAVETEKRQSIFDNVGIAIEQDPSE